MAVVVPATSERNLTPSSTALASPPSTTAGVGLLGQIMSEPTSIMMLRSFVTLSPAEDVTWTVKVEVPAVVGVPEITPVPAPGERLSPPGSVPLAIDHVYGGVPPVALRSAL